MVKSSETVDSDNVPSHHSSSDSQLTPANENTYPDADDESDNDVAISIPQRSPVDTSSDATHPIDITSNSRERERCWDRS